jgi:hypothetical protein
VPGRAVVPVVKPFDTTGDAKDSSSVRILCGFFCFPDLVNQFHSNKADYGGDRQHIRAGSGLQGYQPADKTDELHWQ